jgi:hypothetical protein
MATKVSASTLTVTLTEAITLNGQSYGAENKLSISGVKQVVKRIVTCLNASETNLLGAGDTISTAPGAALGYAAGYFDKDDVRYIRITNLDDTNHVLLTLRNTDNTNANEVGILLDRGQSFIYNADLAGGVDSTIKSRESALSLGAGDSLADLNDIVGIANTADVDLEIYVASV